MICGVNRAYDIAYCIQICFYVKFLSEICHMLNKKNRLILVYSRKRFDGCVNSQFP